MGIGYLVSVLCCTLQGVLIAAAVPAMGKGLPRYL
jgi:hypothetical protein